jgi:hypothetical protein
MPDSTKLERRRQEFRQLHESLVNGEQQFFAWFKEAKFVEAGADNKTNEFLECMADIEKDQHRYRQIINQLPNVAEFSVEELKLTHGAHPLRPTAALQLASSVGLNLSPAVIRNKLSG